MSLPRRSSAYPSTYLEAVQRAYGAGTLVIPHPRPAALRLQFQGLRGALRRENAADMIDALSFHLQENPPALVLRLRDATLDSQAVAAALAENPPPSPSLDADAALARILGNTP